MHELKNRRSDKGNYLSYGSCSYEQLFLLGLNIFEVSRPYILLSELFGKSKNHKNWRQL